jgi:hypothetical protein
MALGCRRQFQFSNAQPFNRQPHVHTVRQAGKQVDAWMQDEHDGVVSLFCSHE